MSISITVFYSVATKQVLAPDEVFSHEQWDQVSYLPTNKAMKAPKLIINGIL